MQLQEYEIKYLCTKAREIFINQPILLELEAPIKICGLLSCMISVDVMELTYSLILQEISMGSITTYCGCLNTVDSLLKLTTFFSAIM